MIIFLSILICTVIILLLGIPVGYAFGLGSFGYIWLTGQDTSFLLPHAFKQISGFALLALPLFVIAGQLMSGSGIADKILDFIDSILGRIRGGLGIVTIVACAFIGAIAGSGSSAIAAIGKIMIERMCSQGYRRGYAVALVGCSSVLAQLIPPSIPMIVFSLIAGIPVTAAFLTTLVPGLLVVFIYCLLNLMYAPKVEGEISKITVPEFVDNVVKKFKFSFWALLMPLIMLGGIYSGLFTPTEAAAVAVGYIIILGLISEKNFGIKGISREFLAAARVSGSIIIILFALAMLSRAMLLEQIPHQISDFLLGLSDSKWVLLLIINLILLIIGMLIDDVSGSIIAAIVLFPVSQQLGINPLHFAAIVGTNLGLGNITPPCAPLLYMAGGIGKAKLNEYIGPTMTLLILGHLPVLMAVTFIPSLSMALPNWWLGI